MAFCSRKSPSFKATELMTLCYYVEVAAPTSSARTHCSLKHMKQKLSVLLKHSSLSRFWQSSLQQDSRSPHSSLPLSLPCSQLSRRGPCKDYRTLATEQATETSIHVGDYLQGPEWCKLCSVRVTSHRTVPHHLTGSASVIRWCVLLEHQF